jgi:low temperature requirement protein LtrA
MTVFQSWYQSFLENQGIFPSEEDFLHAIAMFFMSVLDVILTGVLAGAIIVVLYFAVKWLINKVTTIGFYFEKRRSHRYMKRNVNRLLRQKYQRQCRGL